MSLPLSIYKRLPKQLPTSLGFSRWALSFDGAANYVDCGADPSLDITDELTAGAWVRPRTLHAGYLMNRFYGYWEAGVFYPNGWHFMLLSDGRFEVRFGDGSPWGFVWTGGSYSPDKLYYVVLVIKSGQYMRFLVNGDLIAEVDTTVLLGVPAYNLMIGRYSAAAAYYLDGIMPLAYLYNRILRLDEIRYNMLNYHSPVRGGLVLWLDIEEGAGLTAYDESGYGNHGSLLPVTNPPTWIRNEMWELRTEVGL